MADSENRENKYLICTVDRFELDEHGNQMAVLVFDDGQQLVVGREILPSSARKGAVLRVSFAVDEAETKARQENIKSLQDELFRD